MTNKKAIATVLGIMCFALTAGICIQIKTVKNTNSKVSQNYEENNLRAEVLKYKEKYDNILKETEKIDAQLQAQIDTATTNNSELEEAKNQINDGNKMIGLTEVTGSGIILTIADSEIDSNSVANLSRPGGYLSKLEKRGIEVSTIKKSNSITIPKYTGVLNFKYISNSN